MCDAWGRGSVGLETLGGCELGWNLLRAAFLGNQSMVSAFGQVVPSAKKDEAPSMVLGVEKGKTISRQVYGLEKLNQRRRVSEVRSWFGK